MMHNHERNMQSLPSLFSRIYRLKLLLTGALLLILGLLTAALGDWLASTPTPHLLVALVNSLSDVFLVTGAIGIAVDFFTGRDRDAANLEAARATLKELTPDFTAAVVKGFASSPDDLKRVATPELLDQLATNALGLRLGDAQFAAEIYADVRDQAIRAPERWHDVEVNLRLSTAVERSTPGTPLFDVLVEWEYTVIPSHHVRRFACTSDVDEYDDLVTEIPATSTWFMTPAPGLTARSHEAFELLYFSVDGQERPIRRSERKDGQTYSVTIGEDVVQAAQPVRIKHLYRARVRQAGHFLFIELPQPAKDLSLKLDYTDTDIARLRVMDLVTSARRPEIMQLPAQVDAREVSVDLRGWLLPRAGFTFVWSLTSEDQPVPAAATSHSARTRPDVPKAS